MGHPKALIGLVLIQQSRPKIQIGPVQQESEKNWWKKLIKELLADTPILTIGENLEKANESATSIFLQLSDKIDNAKTKNKAVFKRYKELKLKYDKDGSLTLDKSEVREAIPKTKCSDKTLQKKLERYEKPEPMVGEHSKTSLKWTMPIYRASGIKYFTYNLDGHLNAIRNMKIGLSDIEVYQKKNMQNGF
ncbi:hypothetical protein C1646_663372 [Rhizophagus diaphanus]|nr:hypothetical protein C1646_663372 [Rhizophagus diaphanus] [Rhizophagus sp. MUCL 43196]